LLSHLGLLLGDSSNGFCSGIFGCVEAGNESSLDFFGSSELIYARLEVLLGLLDISVGACFGLTFWGDQHGLGDGLILSKSIGELGVSGAGHEEWDSDVLHHVGRVA
jgi:hypothetical protein